MSRELSNQAVNVTLTTTSEIACVTSPVPDSQYPVGGGISVNGVVTAVCGGTTSALTVRVRQGSGTTGSIVGSASVISAGATPGLDVSVPVSVIDYAPAFPPGVYTITAQQASATGNGTVNYAKVTAAYPG